MISSNFQLDINDLQMVTNGEAMTSSGMVDIKGDPSTRNWTANLTDIAIRNDTYYFPDRMVMITSKSEYGGYRLYYHGVAFNLPE